MTPIWGTLKISHCLQHPPQWEVHHYSLAGLPAQLAAVPPPTPEASHGQATPRPPGLQ